MELKRHYTIYWMARLPLLLIYVSFFFVQLFYNFDTGTHQNASIVLAQKNDAQKLTKATLPANTKVSFRLNKRYHPQPAVTCNPIIIKQVVCYVTSKLHLHYSTGFSPVFSPAAYSLRGPPAVV